MFNGLDKVAAGTIFVRDIDVRRGHSFKLFKKRVQTQLRQRFVTKRIVILWNCLTEEVVSS